MTLSECLEQAARMLSAYPDKTAADGYLGSLAAVFVEYPREVVCKASSPVHGVPRTCKFKSVPAEVIEWCEKEMAFYRRMEDRAERPPVQIEKPQPARPTLDELRVKHGPNWGIAQMSEKEMEKFRQMRDRQHQARVERDHSVMLAEYARLGVAPKFAGDVMVSPSLVKLVEVQRQTKISEADDKRMSRAKSIGEMIDRVFDQTMGKEL